MDAVEVAQGFFKKKFDMVLSGINYGENLSYSIVSSGTFSTAVRAISVNLAPVGIVMSWQTTSDNFQIKHHLDLDISDFIEYPGKKVIELAKMIIKNDFFGKELVNVNFPNKQTNEYKLAAITKDSTKLWNYPLRINKKMLIASPPDKTSGDNLKTDVNTDIGALHGGFITISPLNYLSKDSI